MNHETLPALAKVPAIVPPRIAKILMERGIKPDNRHWPYEVVDPKTEGAS